MVYLGNRQWINLCIRLLQGHDGGLIQH